MQKEIKKTRHFSQSPEEVWEYLTQPELIEQWLMKTDFKPVVGHKFRFICTETAYCEVLEVEPCTRLSYSWQKDSAKSGQSLHSKVVWTLVPKQHGTELQLVHDGFTALEDLLAHDNGWNTCFAKLEEQISTVKK